MRLALVAILAWPDAERAAALADAQSRTTHAAPVAHQACSLFATLLVEAMSGLSRGEVLRSHVVTGPLASIAAGDSRNKDRAAILSSGYVVATFEASLWCLGRTQSFVETLAWRDEIEALTDQLLALGRNHPNTSAAGGVRSLRGQPIGLIGPKSRRAPSPRGRRTAWIDEVRAGDFDAIPQSFRWETSVGLAHLINGYEVRPGFDCLAGLSRQVMAQMEVGEAVELPVLDLWLTLFFRHRAYRHNGGEPEGAELRLLDRLCRALRARS